MFKSGKSALRYGLATAALILGTTAALAQTATPVDVSEISKYVMEFVLALLGGVLTWAGVAARAWLAKRTALADSELGALAQKAYNEMVARSMAYAETYAQTHVPGLDGKVVINNEFISMAVAYANKFWPDLIAKYAPSPDDLARSIIARLPTGPLSAKAEEIAASNAVALK